jgi:DNA polymerase (family 10)
MSKPIKDKYAIAAVLQEIGTLLELKGGEYFKARAYKLGARSIAEVTEDLGRLIKENRLTVVKGIGYALAKQIEQLYTAGESSMLDELRGQMPSGIVELSRVRGLNVKKVEKLQEVLGITTVTELKAAAAAGKLREIKGFTAKTEARILERLDGHDKEREKPIHIHHAWRVAEGIVEYLKTARSLIDIEIAGELRRWQETVSEIVIVASAKRPKSLVDYFVRFPMVVRTEEEATAHAVVQLSEGFKATLLAVKPEQFAITLLHATGSESHLRKLQQIAAKKKIWSAPADRSPDRIGNGALDSALFSRASIGFSPRIRKQNKSSKAPSPLRSAGALPSEAAIYRKLGMQYVPPELREDLGEVEAAQRQKLPEDLITEGDIRGMVHCHTTYSDGKHSVEQMVTAAEALGMKYITITDHSPTAFYAGGVKVDRLQRQWEEIDEVQTRTKIKILKGTESDITADGALDYPDWILEQFDVIVASIHARYKMDSAKMTARIVKAMREPVFKIWGHALGRLIEKRPPFDCDVGKILDVIAESRAAVEINGDPYRLDMAPPWLREARKRKIKFVISVDAHSMGALNNVKYGVGMARRAGITRREVLNTLTVKSFQKAVRPAGQ